MKLTSFSKVQLYLITWNRVFISIPTFLDEKYDIAIELYSKAIELDPQQPTYYGNRSIAYLRRELFGSALNDANEAIRLDPAYVKAYFRRASANMALGKFKLALKDYDAVSSITIFICKSVYSGS